MHQTFSAQTHLETMMSCLLGLLFIERDHLHERTVNASIRLGASRVVVVRDRAGVCSSCSGAPTPSPALVDLPPILQITNLTRIRERWERQIVRAECRERG